MKLEDINAKPFVFPTFRLADEKPILHIELGYMFPFKCIGFCFVDYNESVVVTNPNEEIKPPTNSKIELFLLGNGLRVTDTLFTSMDEMYTYIDMNYNKIVESLSTPRVIELSQQFEKLIINYRDALCIDLTGD